MLNDGFCDPCQTMLRGESEPNGGGSESRPLHLHHSDAESFKHALESQCPLCLRLWTEMDQPTKLLGTRFIYPVQTEFDTPGVYSLEFLTIKQGGPNGVVIVSGSTVLSLVSSELVDIPPHQLPLSSNTGSESALKFLKSNLITCQSSHTQCRSLTSSSSYLPTRAIEIGKTNDIKVFLRDRKNIKRGSSYVALSHCWGGDQTITLTAETATMLRSGIVVEDLPKTFRDAVHVCRRLEIEYLWIDRLCIFQDNRNDWALEAASMREVYSNAVFTIAATAAEDSHCGLFFERNPIPIPPVQVAFTWSWHIPGTQSSDHYPVGIYYVGHISQVSHDINDKPLNKRAWVVQEHYLSLRTMHFSHPLLYWECPQLFSNEIHYTGVPDRLSRIPDIDVRRLKLQSYSARLSAIDHRSPRLEDDIHMGWNLLRMFYTIQQITYESDYLVALAGIVQDVASMIHKAVMPMSTKDSHQEVRDLFIAGMWKHRFHEELCWHVAEHLVSGRPHAWRAPTWSWASMNGVILPASRRLVEISDESSRLAPGEVRPTADIVACHVDNKPSGEVTGGYLRLGCYQIPALLRTTRDDDETCQLGIMALPIEPGISGKGDNTPIIVTMDDPIPMNNYTSNRKFTAVIIIHRRDDEGVLELVEGLALEPSATQPDAFERIGHFAVSVDMGQKEELNRFWARHEKGEYQVITII